MATEAGALRIVDELEKARYAYVTCQTGVTEAKYLVAELEVNGEVRTVREAGGEKELGANAEARKRNLAVGFQADEKYQAAVGEMWTAVKNMRLAEASVQTLEDTLKVYLAYASPGKATGPSPYGG